MTKQHHDFIALLTVLPILAVCQLGIAELHIVLPDSNDLELSDREKRDLALTAASQIAEPSEPLLESVDKAEGVAWLHDQRNEPEARYPLRMTITYPQFTVDSQRKLDPKIVCEGSFNPLVWDYCRETSRWSLRVADLNYVRVNHESITLDSLADMFTALNAADLESPTGASLNSQGVHHMLFNRRTGLYHVIGNSSNGEQFFAYLRPVEDIYGVRYEIADWSCQ